MLLRTASLYHRQGRESKLNSLPSFRHIASSVVEWLQMFAGGSGRVDWLCVCTLCYCVQIWSQLIARCSLIQSGVWLEVFSSCSPVTWRPVRRQAASCQTVQPYFYYHSDVRLAPCSGEPELQSLLCALFQTHQSKAQHYLLLWGVILISQRKNICLDLDV